jgi:hypothetical protein
MLSPRWRRHTIAVVDAMAIIDGMEEFDRVSKVNAQKVKEAAEMGVAPNPAEMEQGKFGASLPLLLEAFDIGQELTDDEARQFGLLPAEGGAEGAVAPPTALRGIQGAPAPVEAAGAVLAGDEGEASDSFGGILTDNDPAGE